MAEAGQEYARVVAMLGNNRVRAKFADGSERLCIIRGCMRRREWVNVGDVVLVAARDLAGDKGDIVFRYLPAEVHRLQRLGEPVTIARDEEEAEMDELVTFAEESEAPGGHVGGHVGGLVVGGGSGSGVGVVGGGGVADDEDFDVWDV